MQTTPSDANTLIKDVPSKSFHVISQKKFKTVLLVVSYMSIIVSIMSFPSVMKLIDNDKQLRQNEHNLFPSTAEIVSTATMCIMGGKFLFGPVTDTIGGEAMLFICMIAMGSLLATCALTGSLNNFAVSWTIISFFYASAWGAVGSVIRVDCSIPVWSNTVFLENVTARYCRLLSPPSNGRSRLGSSRLDLGLAPYSRPFSSAGSSASPPALGAASSGLPAPSNSWCLLSTPSP